MKCASITAMVYGLLLLAGGIIGYAKAQSMASLIAGCVSAALILAGGFAMLKNGAWGLWGYWFVSVCTVLLTAFFGYRFLLTQKIAPSGIMTILSVLVLIILFFQRGKS